MKATETPNNRAETIAAPSEAQNSSPAGHEILSARLRRPIAASAPIAR